jgi:hypothetical protein
MKRALASIACAIASTALACGGAAEPSAAAPSTSAPPEAPPNARTNDTVPEISNARSEIDRAEQSVNAASSDCVAACRALASMERAAEHLCALDAGTECRRARERVDAARERVHASCEGCVP